ncbi:TIGR01777 family oxidoreductase [Demequina aurantiaca]|uniref:TIGR01777 family oxidoreductase n=1 Tax=Demequina aurantiaca TaxID=676200 RepID=UPI003D3282F2
MRVVISGASGLIGTALAESMRADGHEVIALVRRAPQGPFESEWYPAAGEIDQDVVQSADAVVNLAGASIGSKRLTDSYKAVVKQSRVDSTTLIARAYAPRTDGVLISGSAMGYYGARGDEVLSERSEPGDTFLSDIALAWEASAAPAVEAGVRTVFIRSGLVLAPNGGFAARLLPLVKRGLLGGLSGANAWHAWITLHDEVRALRYLIESDHSGPANIIAPKAVRDKELMRALSSVVGKKPGFVVPGWALELAIGPAIEDLMSSQNARPGVLTRLGFTWDHESIEEAAAWVMTEAGHAPPAM